MRSKLLFLATVLLLTVAACGGGESDGDAGTGDQAATTATQATETPASSTVAPDATTVDTQTTATTTGTATASETLGDTILANANPDITSARFEAEFSFIPAEGSTDVPEGSLRMEGEFDNETGNARFFMDFGAFMESLTPEDLDGLPPEMAAVMGEPLELIVVGDTAYMRWGFFNLLLGTDDWIELPADETGSVTGQFGFGAEANSPAELINQLRDANADVQEIGRETVRGVETTHYLATVNLKQLAEELPSDERAELEEQFGNTSIDEFPIELWIGDDGLLYRYQMVLDATTAPEDMGEIQSMTMTFDIFDYGAEITVEPPDPSEVTSIDDLGGVFGAGG